MKALWLCDGRLRLREDLRLPENAPDESRVRVIAAGVCGTDLALVDGLYPFEGVPGHEFVGVVEEGPQALVGKRVVGEINAACGRCPECLAGIAKHCRARTALGIRGRNGAFAEYLQLPSINLHPVPDNVGNDAAVFTEPRAAALDIVERLPPAPGEPPWGILERGDRVGRDRGTTHVSTRRGSVVRRGGAAHRLRWR